MTLVVVLLYPTISVFFLLLTSKTKFDSDSVTIKPVTFTFWTDADCWDTYLNEIMCIVQYALWIKTVL